MFPFNSYTLGHKYGILTFSDSKFNFGDLHEKYEPECQTSLHKSHKLLQATKVSDLRFLSDC